MSPRTQPLLIPGLVRIKPGALDRVGVYLARAGHRRIFLLVSDGLQPGPGQGLETSFTREGITVVGREEVTEASFEHASALFTCLPAGCEAVLGFGGGRALDVAKYVAFLAGPLLPPGVARGGAPRALAERGLLHGALLA